jgi:glycine/D-amino acid oxidase-like deaminating enzyme
VAEELTPRVIVIGAGVMGASVAYRLAQAGADVTVLEAGRVGGGTSGVSIAWTNAHRKPPRAYHDLNVAGMQAHAALRDEFGAIPWWHSGGSVEWELPAQQADQRANVERLQSWDYAAEWIDLAQLVELEPDIDPDVVDGAPIAFFPDEGWLDPVPYAHAMLSAAQRRHGAKLLCGVRVTDLVVRGHRVCGVRCADGTQHEGDMVVNCAGRWTNDLVREAGLHLPMASTAGFLVFTPPVAACVNRVVRSPDIHTRPDGGGRLVLIGATEVVPSLDATLTPAMPEAGTDAAGASTVTVNRRGGSRGGAHRHSSNPSRSVFRRGPGAARGGLLSRDHAQRGDALGIPWRGGGRRNRTWPGSRGTCRIPAGAVLQLTVQSPERPSPSPA